MDAEQPYLEALLNKRNQTGFTKSELNQFYKGKLREVLHGEQASPCVNCERGLAEHWGMHTYNAGIPGTGDDETRSVGRTCTFSARRMKRAAGTSAIGD